MHNQPKDKVAEHLASHGGKTKEQWEAWLQKQVALNASGFRIGTGKKKKNKRARLKKRGEIKALRSEVEKLRAVLARTRRSPSVSGGRKPHPFYDGEAWRALRYRVLTTYGRKCMACGEDGKGQRIHVDHIKPRSKFPELELELSNLQILCESCNLGKSNRDETDWRPARPPRGDIIL